MKRFLTLCLMILGVFWALPGCGQENGAQADLVFVNDSDAAIVTVAVDFQGGNGGTQNADSSPLRRGESFGFEIGEYPVTVYVYDKPVYDIEEGALAQLTIQKAPQSAERWYVTARDGADGLILTSGAQWPEGVPEVTEGGGFWAPSGSQVLVVFLALPLLVLAAVCVATLDKLEPRRRRGLFALFFVLLGLAAVLLGGAWALDQYGLAWRTWIQEAMSAALWVVGLTTGTLTVVYGRRWLPERHKAAGKAVVVLSGLCLASAMLFGTVVGGLWCLGPGETVGAYQGRKAVQGAWTWMETSYCVYEYHGPLVRGAEPIAWGETPLLDGAADAW